MISENIKIDRSSASRFSWSAIAGGFVITMALLLTFLSLGLSLGLAVMDFRDGVSLKSSGWFSSLWIFLSLLLSLGAGSYACSVSSGDVNYISRILNGLIVWAVVSLMIIYGLGKGSTQLVATTGKVLSTQVDNLTNAIPAGTGRPSNLLNFDFESIKKAYENIEAPELKKSISEEVEILSAKAQDALKDTLTHPDKLKQNIEELKLSARNSVKHLESEYDPKTIGVIISNNSDLSAAEAEKVAKEWAMTLEKLGDKFEETINKAEAEVVEMANTTKNAAAFSSFYIFLALILGLLSSLGSSILAANRCTR